MVYSPLARLPAADHGYGPVRLGMFRALFRNPNDLPGKYAAVVLILVAIRRKYDRLEVRITVITLRNTGENIAFTARARDTGRPAQARRYRRDHRVQFRPILGRNPENLHRALRGEPYCHRRRGASAAPDARATCEIPALLAH
jgi:hypothetical protein